MYFIKFVSRYWLAAILLIYVVFTSWKVSAQVPFNQKPEFLKTNSRWLLGPNMGMNFNASNIGSINNTLGKYSKVEVSDPVTGELLFYSDGVTCYNKNHQIMQNGAGIMGDIELVVDQSMVVTPVIGQPGKYYLFSILHIWGYPIVTIYYSVIDMSLDNGMGGVVAGQKNNVLSSGKYSNFATAVPGNNCDIWLVTHLQIEPEFRVFHITESGIDTNYISSFTGSQIQGLSPNNSANHAYQGGSMTISPNRDMLALTNFSITVGGMLLCQFDANTGVVSNAIKLVSADECGIQAAFSPNNKKLYTVTNPFNNTTQDKLLQWDVSIFDSATIAATRNIVGFNTNFLYRHLSANRMRLRGDTIYIALLCANSNAFCDVGLQKVSTISEPNLSGLACNYQPGTISLPPVTGQGFYQTLHPDVVLTIVDTNFVSHDTIVCTTGDAFPTLELKAQSGAFSYLWDDGSIAATRNIAQAGTYRVVTKWGACNYQVDSFIVHQSTIGVDLGPDLAVLCNNNVYNLTLPNLSDVNYVWQNGSTGNTFTVSTPGRYSVEAINNFGCKAYDTINISTRTLISDLGEDITLCKGAPIHFVFSVNQVPDGQIRWNTGSQDTSIIVTEPGTYWVTVKDVLCSDSDTISINEEICECNVQIPNAFSPNQDGINDVFVPIVSLDCPIGTFDMQIFNRWGQLVYQNYSTIGWDGTQNGKPADLGVYYFMIRLEAGVKRNVKTFKGDITLIR